MESSAEEQESSWIASFCQARGNEFFCQVDRNYVEDGFNLYGLKGIVENFGQSLDIILDRAEAAEEESEDAASIGRRADAGAAETARAVELYGLVHARYIVTAHGLEAMHAKYARKDFGCCPRFYCDNYPVLPLGLNDSVGVESVNVYCPRCRHVYRTHNAPDGLDGAFFGTTFAHLFLMTFGFPRLTHPETTQPYVPRVFGFRLHRTAVDRASQQHQQHSQQQQIGAVGLSTPRGGASAPMIAQHHHQHQQQQHPSTPQQTRYVHRQLHESTTTTGAPPYHLAVIGGRRSAEPFAETPARRVRPRVDLAATTAAASQQALSSSVGPPQPTRRSGTAPAPASSPESRRR